MEKFTALIKAAVHFFSKFVSITVSTGASLMKGIKNAKTEGTKASVLDWIKAAVGLTIIIVSLGIFVVVLMKIAAVLSWILSIFFAGWIADMIAVFLMLYFEIAVYAAAFENAEKVAA